jgi:hypothetical protein
MALSGTFGKGEFADSCSNANRQKGFSGRNELRSEILRQAHYYSKSPFNLKETQLTVFLGLKMPSFPGTCTANGRAAIFEIAFPDVCG